MPTSPPSIPYIGSGPYCYANSLAMLLTPSPSPAVVEFAFSSAFGMQFLGRDTVFFDPYGWDPMASFDSALTALGWTSTSHVGKTASHASEMLEAEVVKGPVFVGPVEMGLLRHQPDMRGAIDADHYVVVLKVDKQANEVQFHDPHGFPFATLPLPKFTEAWKERKSPTGRNSLSEAISLVSKKYPKRK